MPKIVDHEARRQEIVAALWRVVLRDGMAGMSVRTVAAEAGASPGALRHYFTTQGELLQLAVESMVAAVAERIAVRLGTLAGRAYTLDDLLGMLEEVLPLDARRKGEFEVWLELVLYARTSPELRVAAEQAQRDLHTMCRQVVVAAQSPEGDVDRHTDQLHGMLDGLSLHLALYPRETSRARVTTALRDLLASFGDAGHHQP